MFNDIRLELKETKTGLIKERTIGSCSEFAAAGINGRLEFINDWIEERGVPQHESPLELISFEFNGRKTYMDSGITLRTNN